MSDDNREKASGNATLTQPSADDDNSGQFLYDFAKNFVFRYKKEYCISVCIFALLFTIASFFATRQYYAEITAIAKSDSSILGMGSKLSSISSLIGSKINADNSDITFAMHYINSRELADSFIDKFGLRTKLFSDDYDDNGHYKYESDNANHYHRLFGKNMTDINDIDVCPDPGPSKRITYEKFKDVFSIDIDNVENIVTVGVRWKNPVEARDWANHYIDHANSILKKKSIDESNNKIKYLEDQINGNTSGEIKEAIYSLVENEMKKITVAEASDEYPFKIVQRAFLPERKVYPKRILFLLEGAMFGFVILCLYICISLVFLKKEPFKHNCIKERTKGKV